LHASRRGGLGRGHDGAHAKVRAQTTIVGSQKFTVFNFFRAVSLTFTAHAFLHETQQIHYRLIDGFLRCAQVFAAPKTATYWLRYGRANAPLSRFFGAPPARLPKHSQTRLLVQRWQLGASFLRMRLVY
jgi:hypothetical protein